MGLRDLAQGALELGVSILEDSFVVLDIPQLLEDSVPLPGFLSVLQGESLELS